MDGKGVLFVVFFGSFRQAFWHLHLQLQRWNQENIYIFLWCFRLPLVSQEIPCSATSTLPWATAMFVGFLIMLSSSSLISMIESSTKLWFPEPQSPAVTHGFRWHTTPFPRRKVPRWPVNCVEIHKGEALQSWDILMRIMILEYETILGVSGYNLISCFHKWMWKSLQAETITWFS